MGMFSRKPNREPREPRRNTEDDGRNLQYYTNRGVDLSYRSVQDMSRHAASRPIQRENRDMYPHPYNDREKVFPKWESRDRPLYEAPATYDDDFDISKKPTPSNKMKTARNPHRNDRARVLGNPPNDPGPYRVVGIHEEEGGGPSGLGVMYHPEGDRRGFVRSPLEPMSREGHRVELRYEDDRRNSSRKTTWPARDYDAEDLARYETQYKQERRPRRR
ncbi:unnamed protein product [Clonostachys rosea f. rosea IK726]|uniref:Uncharacterized protein n=2 Tax=Bionectria ochroleuca TaxID=29856 RepID=A0ACA9UDE2_BIOOC|nr:unnamed protein product [Clonostachys rosea f. rosea IK726]